MKCGIYGIRNMANGKWYIGQGIINSRKNWHFAALKRGDHFNRHLQSAFSKYGKDNFEFRVLEEVSEDMLDVRECAWIDFYKSTHEHFGYNLRTGGQLTHHLSEETKRKMSEAHKGKVFSKEHKRKMVESRKGYRHSGETRKKISEAKKGKPSGRRGYKHSEEAIRKNREAHIGKSWSEKRRANYNKKQGELKCKLSAEKFNKPKAS